MKLLIAALLLAQAGDDATLSGKVTDAVTHQPVAGARIFYLNSSTTSDANGAWSIRIRPGPRNADGPVSVTKKGYDASVDSTSIAMKPGESKTLDIELSPVAHISGHLVDRDSGKPLTGFVVVARRLPYARPLESKPSGTDGSFALAGDLPSGQYLLEIVSKEEKRDKVGYGRSWYPGVPRIEMAAPVTVSPAKTAMSRSACKNENCITSPGLFMLRKAGKANGFRSTSSDRKAGRARGRFPTPAHS
jgi:hypothetical protein